MKQQNFIAIVIKNNNPTPYNLNLEFKKEGNKLEGKYDDNGNYVDKNITVTTRFMNKSFKQVVEDLVKKPELAAILIRNVITGNSDLGYIFNIKEERPNELPKIFSIHWPTASLRPSGQGLETLLEGGLLLNSNTAIEFLFMPALKLNYVFYFDKIINHKTKNKKMKKVLTLVAILFITISSFAQPGQKKPGKKQPATTITAAADTTGKKTVQLEYVEKTETVKVRIICYGENNEMIWLNGFVTVTYGTFQDGKQQKTQPDIIQDENKKPFNVDNIVEVKPFNWK